MNDKLITFYSGSGKDSSGRTIESIWQFDYDRLESVHDYIQWLFPSSKRSNFNWSAPILDFETIQFFNASADLKDRLRKSLLLMLDFYGLEFDATASSANTIQKAAHYSERKNIWQSKQLGLPNHNLLRLTRILEALQVLGFANESLAVFKCLEQIQDEEPNKISDKTLHYWRAAAGATAHRK